jgi:hypothetical protein
MQQPHIESSQHLNPTELILSGKVTSLKKNGYLQDHFPGIKQTPLNDGATFAQHSPRQSCFFLELSLQ